MDPAKRNQDFADRVVDAAIATGPCGAFFQDISGWHLFAINPKPLSPGKYIRYLAEVTATVDGQNSVVSSMKLYPLNFQTMEHVDPPVEPTVWTDLAVEYDMGTFTVPLESVVIPGAANAILPNTAVTVNGSLDVCTRTPDFFCGEVTGMVVQTGSSLDTSTFAAQRVEQGTIGDALPEPLGDCASQP